MAGVVLFDQFSAALRAADPASTAAVPSKAELGVYILDITDIDKPGGSFTLHVLLGTGWQDPERVF